MNASSFVRRRVSLLLVLITLGSLVVASAARADEDLAKAIRAIPPQVVDPKKADELRGGVNVDVRARLKTAEDRESEAWSKVKSQADWEAFRKPRLDALRSSLGIDPAVDPLLSLSTSSIVEGDGFTIANVRFTSRPGVVVTGNLYRPKEQRGKLPGFLICHSHHAPKTQGELQDMGMTWARQGCAVLVLDMLGHGERRTHDFAAPGKYAGDYKPSRQDYYFRYNTGVQLAAVGESLMGWMVRDLRNGVTLLTKLPEVDSRKIVLLGAVAGGGDPAGVTGALDDRIAVVVPFNFGGYEPEDGFPLPADAERSFHYAGGGSWESTRNLRLSARDGFLPWTIVASTAPRHLVYAHEFRWDDQRDPVWKRIGKVFDFYEVHDRIGTIVGHGGVRQSSSEASHCTNIGPVHRAQLYPLLDRWFDLDAPKEYGARREPDELRALPADFKAVPLHETLQTLAEEKLAAAREARRGLHIGALKNHLRKELEPLIGSVGMWSSHAVGEPLRADETGRLSYAYSSIEIPSIGGRHARSSMVMLRTKEAKAERPPLVVAVAQEGKEKLLHERADVFAACLARGAVVVVCDLRGTGSLEPREEGRGRTGGATSRSSSEQMLGQTMLGHRLVDLRTIVYDLRNRPEFRQSPVSLYGTGLAPPNDPQQPIAAPLDAADLPRRSEPLGAELCLLAGVYEFDLAAIYIDGGLVSQTAILEAPYFYVPHDALVPGLAAKADTADLLATQMTPIWTADLRDGANRAITEERRARLQKDMETQTPPNTIIHPRKITLGKPPAKEIAEWLVR